MPGSTVIRKDIAMPGYGYVKGACRMGQFDANGQNDVRTFWAEGLERVSSYWLMRYSPS
jgi:hypothetical protein